jgi:hypothetical protein
MNFFPVNGGIFFHMLFKDPCKMALVGKAGEIGDLG